MQEKINNHVKKYLEGKTIAPFRFLIHEKVIYVEFRDFEPGQIPAVEINDELSKYFDLSLVLTGCVNFWYRKKRYDSSGNTSVVCSSNHSQLK
jgi:hypothetical protein